MSASKNKTKKNRILFILFMLLNFGVVAWTALKEFSGNSNAAKLKDLQIRWTMLIPAALCWIAAILIEVLKYMLVMHRTCGYSNFRTCSRTVLLGRYYDNITPSGVGGQPFQIYYMHQNGVPAAQSSVIPISGFLSMQFGFILLALGSFIAFRNDVNNDVIRISSYVGLVFYAFFPSVILMFTFLPKTSGSILAWFVKIGHKMHLVRDKVKTINTVKNSVTSYADCIHEVLRSPLMCFVTLLMGVTYHAALCSIPYFVIRAFAGEIPFIQCFVTTLAIYAAITFIPTPGNAGAAEGSFYVVFSMLTSGYTFWAMLTWRFFTYYSFIIIGFLIYLEKYLISRRHKKGTAA